MAINGINTEQTKAPRRLFGLLPPKKQAVDPDSTNRGKPIGSNTDMIRLMGYKGMTNDQEAFIILKDADDGYADILSIQGQALNTMSGNAKRALLLGFDNFLQVYLEDMKIIATPFQVDTSLQQSYEMQMYAEVSQELRYARDPRIIDQLKTRLKYINNQIALQKQADEFLFNEEYFLLYFGKTRQEIYNNRQNLISWGGKTLILSPFHDLKKKENVLKRINNLNTKKG